MAARTYQNFDLVIEDAGEATYRARVTSSPRGDTPSTRFTLPFDAKDLELLMLKLDPGRSGTRRAAATAHAQAAQDFGGPLFEAVFDGEVMLAWMRCQQSAREHGQSVRLRLRLADAPALAGLPWELLYDKRTNSFLAQSEKTPVVRYLDTAFPPGPMAVAGPLHILTVVSSPPGLPELDVDGEWRRVQDALKDRVAEGSVRLDRLPQPTLSALGKWLRHNDVHILHFIGHGDFDPKIEDGVVFFTDEYGRPAPVSPSTLGPYLQDHDPLRLVLLNACQTGRGDADDAFGGMAQGLIQKQIDAVVAMQFPITDMAAATFTAEFYGAVADGLPVDQAATSARKALMQSYGDEWATPVLFMRTNDGAIFTGIRKDPDATQRVTRQESAPPTSPAPAGTVAPEPVRPAEWRQAAPVSGSPIAAPAAQQARQLAQPQPGRQQPGYQQPTYGRPTYQQPTYQQPTYQPAAQQQPAYQPGYQQPQRSPAAGTPARGQIRFTSEPEAPDTRSLWKRYLWLWIVLIVFGAFLLLGLILEAAGYDTSSMGPGPATSVAALWRA